MAKLAETTKVPVEQAMENLRQGGFANATAESNLRQQATQNGRRPIEIAQVVQEGHR